MRSLTTKCEILKDEIIKELYSMKSNTSGINDILGEIINVVKRFYDDADCSLFNITEQHQDDINFLIDDDLNAIPANVNTSGLLMKYNEFIDTKREVFLLHDIAITSGYDSDTQYYKNKVIKYKNDKDAVLKDKPSTSIGDLLNV